MPISTRQTNAKAYTYSVKQKIFRANNGRIVSPETKKKLSEAANLDWIKRRAKKQQIGEQ